MSEATLNPPSLAQINKDLGATVAEEMSKNLLLQAEIDALKIDRDEWREQHENLLSVRETDLKTFLEIGTVFNTIKEERRRQDKIWGGATHDDTHDEQEWIGYIDEQLTKASDNGEYRERFIKIAALAVAALESMDRLGR